MAQKTSEVIFLRASQNVGTMELLSSISVTVMLAGLGIQDDVTVVEAAFEDLCYDAEFAGR